jgi:hypothetical protein
MSFIRTPTSKLLLTKTPTVKLPFISNIAKFASNLLSPAPKRDELQNFSTAKTILNNTAAAPHPIAESIRGVHPRKLVNLWTIEEFEIPLRR